MNLMYSVVSPRDTASGMATGKRMHKPLKLTMELGRGAAPTNTFTIDEAGSQVAFGTTDAKVEAALTRATKTRSNIQSN